MKLPTPTEHQSQVTLVQWARLMESRHPELQGLAAIPNGGWRHKATAGKLKAEGVRAGYPDIILDVARGPYHGLRIELKRLKGGKLSPAQQAWHVWLTAQGYRVVVCKGWEAARDAILNYLNLGEQ